MNVPNRLARNGEDLTTCRFPTGSIGLAPKPGNKPKRGFLEGVMSFFSGPKRKSELCAVCIAPGAKLRLTGIPADIQRGFLVGAEEDVVFDQRGTNAYSYRDGVRFSNGKFALLQQFREGVAATVLSLEGAEQRQPTFEEQYAAPAAANGR